MNVRWLWLFRSAAHDMTCREAVSLVTAYLDDALGVEDHERFEEHLGECPHCLEHLQQIQATIRVTGSLRTEDLDPRQRDDLMSLYRRWRSIEVETR
ncbi:anti-sigma factor [Marmoricola sp. URHB0036]|uniref:anti-sigma factor family protein n=1 Tax=Marmoricola sp. URHB0036 TaxID=1298863 RepID=UPI0004142D7C|nr:zf-HC2 domain-containing protein [Marmoricola sp. URHB0036]